MKYLLALLIFTGCALGQKKQVTFDLSEPAFCDLETFKSKEIPVAADGLERARAFKLGQVTLVGLAVGHSEVEAVKTLANQFSTYRPDEKFCTFYLNDGNSEASEAFNHHNVSNPLWSSPEKISTEFSDKLAGIFTTNQNNVLKCLKVHNYAAQGCDGNRHRGPSGYSMILSYAGCKPEHSVAIVDTIWPVSWWQGVVSKEKRLAIAQKAYELGEKDPAGRKEFRSLMESN